MEKIKEIAGRAVPIKGDDIDTDRILPARFLKEITFENMGKYAFYDERFDKDGNMKRHVLNDPRYSGASVLVVNKNFGCGSSREHAPQALMRFGIRAIIGESFSEIFAGNCAMLGMPILVAGNIEIDLLIEKIESEPEVRLKIDISKLKIAAKGIEIKAQMNPSSRKSILEGTWDTMSVILNDPGKIINTAMRIPYLNGFEVGKWR